MNICVLKETFSHEERVSVTPEVAKKMIQLGYTITIEKGCGIASNFCDDLYEAAGCQVEKDISKVLKKADIVICVSPLSDDHFGALKKEAIVIGALKPYKNAPQFKKWAKQGLSVFSLELLPRITRAQSMDILSSQSNLAGYKAVIDAVALFKKAIPLMMTAAGTIAAARILILGAGVAGLQAIATARRLGAIVSAFDVRSVAKEQVESLGATFIQVDTQETGDATGGYAKEMSDQYKKAQAEKLAEVIKQQDIIITTAQIPGKQAPVLITEDMVKSMKTGSVIIDLATETGGNCALSTHEKTVIKHGITIVGPANIFSQLSQDASHLYARNLLNFITHITDTEKKCIKFDLSDEIVQGTLITHEGKIVHPTFANKE